MIDTSLDSSNLYFLVAVLQGIVLSGLIIFRKPSRQPNLFLGLLIFLFSLSLLHLVLEESIHAFNSKFPIPMDFSLAFGPLAYLHVLGLKKPNESFIRSKYLHFLPSLLLDGLLFTGTFLYIRTHEEWAYANVENIQAFALMMLSIALLQLGTYTYLIYAEMRSAYSLPKDFAPIRRWLKMIVFTWILILGFLVIAVPIAMLNIELVDENSYLLYKPMGVIIGLCIYGLGYMYLLKYMDQVNTYLDRFGRIKFSHEQMQTKKDDLLAALQKDKLYLSESLSVARLAEHLDWPINDVSLIINETLFTNFNDLINAYRIEAFKNLADQPANKKYSILGLAQEVGFGSKASFYRAFKKEAGMTPSEYMKAKQVK